MKVRNIKNQHLNVLIVLLLMTVTGSALAWSATFLGGKKWAITCADGTNHSYSGGSGGLDYVGPALCPGGVAGPMPSTTVGIPLNFDRDIVLNNKEVGDSELREITKYPPNGYPCLGCEPCNDGSGDYCDIANKNRVYINDSEDSLLNQMLY